MEQKKCEYGCGQEGKYNLKSVNKLCCSEFATQCPSLRKKNSEALKKIWNINEHNLRRFTEGDRIKSHEAFKKNLQEKYSTMKFEDLPHAEKRRQLLFEQNFKCLICEIEDWLDKPIILHMDHIDGNKENPLRENLRLICPNCHSQTSTYCRGNKKIIPEKKLKDELIKTNCNITKALINLNRTPGGSNWNKSKVIIQKYNLTGRVDELA